MCSMAVIDEYWTDLRLRREGACNRFPSFSTRESVAPLLEWAQNTTTQRDILRVIPGSTQEEAYRILVEVLSDRVSFGRPTQQHLILLDFVRNLRVPRNRPIPTDLNFLPPDISVFNWDILWGLCCYHNVTTPSNFRDLALRFQGVSKVYSAINEIRFEAREKQSFATTMENLEALSRWIEGTLATNRILSLSGIKHRVTLAEQEDILLFLLTLAAHNRIVGSTNLFIPRFETFQHTSEVYSLILEASEWAKFGCPLNLLIGWRGLPSDETQLRGPRLLKQLKLGMQWVTAKPC